MFFSGKYALMDILLFLNSSAKVSPCAKKSPLSKMNWRVDSWYGDWWITEFVSNICIYLHWNLYHLRSMRWVLVFGRVMARKWCPHKDVLLCLLVSSEPHCICPCGLLSRNINANASKRPVWGENALTSGMQAGKSWKLIMRKPF